MRQEYIETFLEIVKTRNISAAAENLHLSQSALSSRLKSLEEEMGVCLFQRGKGNRYVSLTAQGQRFVPLAERWMLLLRDTDAIRNDAVHSVRLGCIDSISAALLLPLSRKLAGSALPLRLEIISQQSHAMYDYIANRDYDIVLVAAKGYRAEIEVVPFFAMDMSIVINSPEPPDLTLPSQLDPRQEIYMEYGSEIRSWRELWWPNALPQLSIDSFQLLEHYLALPGKWALIPTGILNRLTNRDALQRCSFGGNDPPRRICYHIHHRRSSFFSTPACQQLFELMQQQIREDPTLTLL